MDRSLDEIIAERPSGNRAGRRGGRRNDRWGRDGIRKSNIGKERGNPDLDWVHDKFEDDRDTRRPYRNSRSERFSPEPEKIDSSAKIRVDNLHYDLTEEELEELFTRIGPVQKLSLRYDRAGRSEGTAFVTYTYLADARAAIREFDGANANGQPIRLTLLPPLPVRSRGRNVVESKPRSLFERISAPVGNHRSRSASPGKLRRSDVSGPTPEGIDRYVPGRDSRSPPIFRRRGGRGRRGENGRGRDNDRQHNNGRPKKTQEELDAEMDDYWGKGEPSDGNANATIEQTTAQENASVPIQHDEDVDMIE